MNTVAYAMITLGLVLIYAAFKGRGIKELPGDLADLGIGLATFDNEKVSEVLNRTKTPVSNTAGFDKVAAEVDAAASSSFGNPSVSLSGSTGGSGKTVADLIALAKALQAKGWLISENKAMGDNPRPGVHLATGYHYKFDNSGAIDVNWPNASQEARMADAIVPEIRRQGFHVLWRVKGHYDHFHVDISRRDI